MKVTAIDKRTQKLIDERVNEKLKKLMPIYQTIFTASVCVALNHEFGFGGVRLQRVMAAVEKYCSENLGSYTSDDVVKEKVQRDLEQLGIYDKEI